MAWRNSREDFSSRNNSVELLPYLSGGNSQPYRDISPYGRPSGRLAYDRPRDRFPRNISRDSFQVGDENCVTVSPPAKRRPQDACPKYVGFSAASQAPPTTATPVGDSKPLLNGIKIIVGGGKKDGVSKADVKEVSDVGSGFDRKPPMNEPKLECLLKPIDTKSAPAVVNIPRARRIQRAAWNPPVQTLNVERVPETDSEDAKNLAQLLKPLDCKSDNSTEPSPAISTRRTRKNEKVKPNQAVQQAGTSSAAVTSKVVARSTGTTITTLSQVQETSKPKKKVVKREWWQIGDGSAESASSSSDDDDEVQQVLDKLNGRSRRPPSRLFTAEPTPQSPSKSTKKLTLPELTTQIEKDLLSDIFADLQKDVEDNTGASKGNPIVPLANDTLRVRKKKKSPKKVPIVDSDSDSVISGMSDSEPSTSMKVHMNLGSLPVYNAATFTNSPANEDLVESSRPRKVKGRVGKAEKTKDGFNLSSILKALPGDSSNWIVDKKDTMRAKGHYLQEREERTRLNLCHRCGACLNTNKRHYCYLSCALCYGSNHFKDKCPFKDTLTTLECDRCGMTGHVAAVCSEIWRQYHHTTSHSGPLLRVSSVREEKFSCCYNCGHDTHYGHQCPRRPFDRTSRPRPDPLIKTYDKPKSLMDFGMETDQHPLDEFHEFVTNNLTADNAEQLNGTPGAAKSAMAKLLTPRRSTLKKKKRGHSTKK